MGGVQTTKFTDSLWGTESRQEFNRRLNAVWESDESKREACEGLWDACYWEWEHLTEVEAYWRLGEIEGGEPE